MNVKQILLLAFGGIAFIAMAKLFLDVREAPAQPAPAKIEAARQNHKRTRTAPSPANVGADPWARSSGAPVDPPPTSATARPSIPTPSVVEDVPAPPAVAPVSPAAAATPNLEGDPKLEVSTLKDEANKAYDKQDFETAIARAESVLAKEPGDVRMLRVLVSSLCQMGDADKAQGYWSQLPPHDQNQMNRRCQRFGVTFKE